MAGVDWWNENIEFVERKTESVMTTFSTQTLPGMTNDLSLNHFAAEDI